MGLKPSCLFTDSRGFDQVWTLPGLSLLSLVDCSKCPDCVYTHPPQTHTLKHVGITCTSTSQISNKSRTDVEPSFVQRNEKAGLDSGSRYCCGSMCMFDYESSSNAALYVCILFFTSGCVCVSAVDMGGGGLKRFQGPSGQKEENVRRHNELPVALCAGNTAGVQPESLSVGGVLKMLRCP